VADSYKHYRNRYQSDPDKLQELARQFSRSESLQKLILRPEIYAKHLSQPATVPRRSGLLDQPGRPKRNMQYVAQADAGDYLAQLDGEDVIVPAVLFEAILIQDEPAAVT
jgi:hypothetical protein